MRIKLPLFDNPTLKQLHPMCEESIEGRLVNEGVQLLYAFPNGYGASVVQFSIYLEGSGRPTFIPGKTVWELGILKIAPGGLEEGYELCWDTEVAEDVIKPLRSTDVERYLQLISSLEPNTGKLRR